MESSSAHVRQVGYAQPTTHFSTDRREAQRRLAVPCVVRELTGCHSPLALEIGPRIRHEGFKEQQR